MIEAGDVGNLGESCGVGMGADLVDMLGGALIELPMNQAMMLPLLAIEDMAAAGFDPNVGVAALDAGRIRRFGTQMLEAQRRMCMPARPGDALLPSSAASR